VPGFEKPKPTRQLPGFCRQILSQGKKSRQLEASRMKNGAAVGPRTLQKIDEISAGFCKFRNTIGQRKATKNISGTPNESFRYILFDIAIHGKSPPKKQFTHSPAQQILSAIHSGSSNPQRKVQNSHHRTNGIEPQCLK
jgi:hypothetical protein